MTARQHRLRHRQQESPRQGVPSHTLQILIFRKVRSRDTTFSAQRDPTWKMALAGDAFFEPFMAAPNRTRCNMFSGRSNQRHISSSTLYALLKATFVWFAGMPKFRVQKSLSKITGALKAYVGTVEAN